jgi:two-component system chemotaxis response regulator CheB
VENLSKDNALVQDRYQAIVIGVSAGGFETLNELLPSIPSGITVAVIIVQHLHPQQDGFFIESLNAACSVPVREAEEKEPVLPGSVYFAPPNYHLLLEADKTFSLTIDEKVNFSRPSIDVLFETAAEVYGPSLIGIILTGASKDGASGLQWIRKRGGLAIVQDPATALFPAMPAAALVEGEVDLVLSVPEIGRFLAQLR